MTESEPGRRLSPYLLDERTGCVAIYRGPKVNCLFELHDDEKAVFTKPIHPVEMQGLKWLVEQMNRYCQ